MLFFLLTIWFIISTAWGWVKCPWDWCMQPLSFIQSRKTTWTSSQNKWLRHKTQARDPTRAEPWAELWNLIRMRDRGFLSWRLYSVTVVESHCHHMWALCSPREEQSRLSPCQEGCQEHCPDPGPMLDLPARALRWVSFSLCSAWSQGWITDISVSKDLRMSEIPISTTEKGWFATMAWWKSVILGFPFWVQGSLTDSSAMVEDGTFPEHLAASSGSRTLSGRHQAAEPCLPPASTDCSLI